MSENSGVPGKTVPQLIRAKAAAARKEARDSRTAAEQLVLLKRRPGQCMRERQRLSRTAS